MDDINDIKKNLGMVGLVGRFKPLHNGAALMLDTVCKNADHVKIGIGSTNKYNVRNPFTPDATMEMINLYLKPKFNNYEILFVPDFAHLTGNEDGTAWKRYIVDHFGKLDNFVTGNPYVKSLLGPEYKILHPDDIIPPEDRLVMRGTSVRMTMAKGEDYRSMVPAVVAGYLEDNGLVSRFRKEFGSKTLGKLPYEYWMHPEDIYHEKNHTMER